MKKILVFFLIFILFLYTNALVIQNKNNLNNSTDEIRGIYISYLEYLTYFQGNSLTINKSYINKMLDNIKSLKFNTIFLHVSPFSDSIYSSKTFPYSYTLTGLEGKNPGMDYLEYFIKEAKKRNIKIHAWINPYRISNSNDFLISEKNPAYSYLDTNIVYTNKNGIYYNPASLEVINLIVNQVLELITNYDLAGIHFDDYFYPDLEIDKLNYESFCENNNISLEEYRLLMTNTLIKNVYKTIKDYDSSLIFSIAPDGNINNNYNLHFADIKTWLIDDNYVDIIMPQVYYGFDNQYKPFLDTLKEWHSLIQNNVKIIPVLAFYKVGSEDLNAGVSKNEWLENNDIIKRQVEFSRTLEKYEGFALFRYEFLFNEELFTDNTKFEINNLKSIMNN